MKNILTALLLLFVFSLQAQNELSLHFMQNLIQRNSTNPATQSPHKIDIALPSVYINGFNSSFKNEYLVHKADKTLLVEPTRAIEKMEESGNLLQGNMEVSFLSVAFKIKKMQVSLFHNIHFDTYLSYPKDLAELAWYGNAPYAGETLDIAPTMDLWLYNEYGVGVAYPINEKLSIGGRVKLLNGYFAMNTEKSEVSLYTDPDYYQVQIESDILFNTAGYENFLDQDNENGFLASGVYDDLIFTENRGFGLDLGLEYQMNENLSFSASIMDIGSIKWQKEVINNQSQGSFNYSGLEVHPFDENEDFNFEEVQDSVENILDFQESNNAFTTQLPKKFHLAGIFENDNKCSLGVIIYGEKTPTKFNPSFALSIQKQFKDVFSIGTLLGVPSHGGFNLGLNATLKVLGVQFYTVSDNVIPLYNPLIGKNFNIRAGVNIAINGKKKKKAEEIIPPTPSSGTGF